MKKNHELTLMLLENSFAVSRFGPKDEIPKRSLGDYYFMMRTPDETTVVTDEHTGLDSVPCEKGWRMFQIKGTLDFSETGIIAGITGCLADQAISVFAVSTYDTDYFMVKNDLLEKSIDTLKDAGYQLG